ncbi:LysR family transcriptional regulator [Erysipelothrix piscisicarius]|uniref:LysR family transcriptional regulator n=1 Tax=Erysipelothrix piscisicarius TaxID=2485784 RepID=UPI002F927C6C
MYISQPAVSQAIKELETVLKRNLFVRKSGGIEPTPFGTQFYVQLTHFLKGYHQFESDVFKLDQSNPLRIGSSITVAKTTLPDIIKDFEALNSTNKTVTTIANAQDVLELLVEDKVDVAIIEGAMQDDGFETIHLGSYELKFFQKLHLIFRHSSHYFNIESCSESRAAQFGMHLKNCF